MNNAWHLFSISFFPSHFSRSSILFGGKREKFLTPCITLRRNLESVMTYMMNDITTRKASQRNEEEADWTHKWKDKFLIHLRRGEKGGEKKQQITCRMINCHSIVWFFNFHDEKSTGSNCHCVFFIVISYDSEYWENLRIKFKDERWITCG